MTEHRRPSVPSSPAAGESERRRPSTRRPRPPRKGSGGTILRWLLLLLVVAGAGWWFWQQDEVGEGFNADFAASTELPAEQETLAGDRAVVLVFPEWDASGFVTEQRQIPSRDRPGEDLLGVMRVLCEGPRISGAISALPAGTQALAAFFNPADRSVVLDFSQELVTGHPGGSAAESATLTSILRTVTLNFPEARSCAILVDGAQVETLAGHLNLARPFDPRRWL